MATVSTPIVEQLQQRPGTIMTYPATADAPEIRFYDSDIETSYAFLREDGNEVGFVLTHTELLHDKELHLAVLEPVNCEAIEEVHFTYAEAKILRAFLNRPEVARWLDAAE